MMYRILMGVAIVAVTVWFGFVARVLVTAYQYRQTMEETVHNAMVCESSEQEVECKSL